jgi:hypothetical protein
VLDTSGWDTNPNGPYVSHGPEAEVHNCSGQRLGNCLRDLAGWVDRNGSNVPIVVRIDMKTSVTQPIAWLPSTISNLDPFRGSYFLVSAGVVVTVSSPSSLSDPIASSLLTPGVGPASVCSVRNVSLKQEFLVELKQAAAGNVQPR